VHFEFISENQPVIFNSTIFIISFPFFCQVDIFHG
jgi:hypothetical protein